MKRILFILMLVSYIFCACNSASNDKKIIGEWILIEALGMKATDSNFFIRFKEDGTYEQTPIEGADESFKTKITWKMSGDSICQTATFINQPDLEPVNSCYKFTMNDEELTLDFEGMISKYRRK
jgi:hypothetical protein